MKNRKTLIIILSSAIALLLIGIVLFAVISKSDKELENQLKLADKYLSELDYAQAIAAYEVAIEIDPHNVAAYLGIAEAYMALGDLDNTIAILEEGYGLTKDATLGQRLKEVKAMKTKAEYADQVITDTPTPIPEETSTIIFIPWEEAGIEDYAIDWIDPDLESCMREVTGIRDRDIMLSDVWEITELDLSLTFMWNVHNLHDLTALGVLYNLQYLDVSFNKVEDISVLANLPNLVHLDLAHNYNINDISSLADLTHLEFLDLASTYIDNISALTNLKNLKFLNLDGVELINGDISPLADLTKLETLSVYRIHSLAPLANLTNLKSLYVGICTSEDEDISFLSNFTQLQRLSLVYCGISDISALANLTNLQYLALYNNNISDISPLANLTNLTELAISDNPITDYSPVAFVEYLYY